MASRQGQRRRITLERTFDASIEDVWALWTTTDGIEAWWGPDGYDVEVRRLDVRPGGELAYAMIATGADQIDFMRKAGMPLTTENRMTYTEVVPMRRLAYVHDADFIPGVEPYEVAMEVEFEPVPAGIRMVMTIDAMHDEEWTRMAVMGWENQFEKAARKLAEWRAAR